MMLYYTFRLFYCKCLWISKTAAFTSSFNIVVILTVLVPWENSTWLMSLKEYLCTIRWSKSNSALKQAARSAPSCDFNAGLVEHAGFVQQSCRICRLLTQNNRLELLGPIMALPRCNILQCLVARIICSTRLRHSSDQHILRAFALEWPQ